MGRTIPLTPPSPPTRWSGRGCSFYRCGTGLWRGGDDDGRAHREPVLSGESCLTAPRSDLAALQAKPGESRYPAPIFRRAVPPDDGSRLSPRKTVIGMKVFICN